MNDKPVDLDHRRGLASQHSTDLRRLTAEVEAERAALHILRELRGQALLSLHLNPFPPSGV